MLRSTRFESSPDPGTERATHRLTEVGLGLELKTEEQDGKRRDSPWTVLTYYAWTNWLIYPIIGKVLSTMTDEE